MWNVLQYLRNPDSDNAKERKSKRFEPILDLAKKQPQARSFFLMKWPWAATRKPSGIGRANWVNRGFNVGPYTNVKSLREHQQRKEEDNQIQWQAASWWTWEQWRNITTGGNFSSGNGDACLQWPKSTSTPWGWDSWWNSKCTPG